MNRANIARDHDSTKTKHDNSRFAEPTRILPKLPQSTAGHGLEPQERLRARRADRAHVATQLHDRAGVAPRAHHLEEARRAQAWMVLEDLREEAFVGVEHGGADLCHGGREPVGLDRVPDGGVVYAEFGRDRADAPVLGVE
jgi:hypothetical protein